MKHLKLGIVITFLGLATAAAASGDAPFRKTVRSGSHSADVQVDHKKITVRLSRGSDGNPRAVQFVFYDVGGKPTTVELESLSTPNLYAGTLPGAQESFIGAELRIPLDSEKVEILR